MFKKSVLLVTLFLVSNISFAITNNNVVTNNNTAITNNSVGVEKDTYSKVLHINLMPLPASDIADAMNILEERLRTYSDDHEAELLKIILYFKSGKSEFALTALDKLINKVPNFQLAVLLKADLLVSVFDNTPSPSEASILALITPIPDNTKKQLLESFREQIQLRLRALLTNKNENLPKQILALGKSVKKALLVDKQANRLYVFNRTESGELFQEVNDYYITSGKRIGDKTVRGDLRTPEGVYFVTSWINPEKLPAKYGVGAFPINYPNELDKHNGKTGSGIWLHGLNKDYFSRPPRDSKGCVVLANIDLETLKSEIKPGITPVVITDKVEWINRTSWEKEREAIFHAVESWRVDWESMNIEKYLSHYSKDFWSGSHDLKSWTVYKNNILKSKTNQSIELSDLSVLLYPKKDEDKREIAVVRFYQKYKSNNLENEMQKRLYLIKNEGDWKILYEGR